MIITLTKADFSASNIGTLSTWSILKTLGTGATSSNTATFVDRGAAYNTTITIASGYEIGSAGVTVTMGGTAITPIISGNTITISVSAVTGNVVIKVPTVNTSTGEEDGGDEGDTPIIPPTTSILLAQNDTTLSSPKRLASKAYVANMLQSFEAGTTIDYIELPIVAAGALSTTAQTIPSLEVWVFNMETNTPVEKIIDGQSYTSEASTIYSNCYSIKVAINKQFDYPFYFGYANTPNSAGYAISYYTEAGNYLSGTAFTIGTAIASNSGSVAIHAAIYGEGSTYVVPDDVDDLTQVAFYNGTAAQKMAGNCYVANPNQTVPANTKISILDVMVAGSSIEGVNIYVVSGDTNTIVEMLADEQTITPVLSSRIGAHVIRLNVDKTYTYPVYFMFNAERTNSSSNAMLMVSNATGSILLTDDERKPAVGDVLSDFTNHYNIGHAIYS